VRKVSSAASGDIENYNSPAVFSNTVYCSGHGRCQPNGCECIENFSGIACDQCKLGWSGALCDKRWNGHDVSSTYRLCQVAAVENPMAFGEDEIKTRWNFINYKKLTSEVVEWQHYGTRISMPQVFLAKHTHVHIQATIFVVDAPDQIDSGVLVRVAKTQLKGNETRDAAEILETAERYVFQAHIPFSTGVSSIGIGKADNWVTIDLYVDWPHSTASVDFEVWSPDKDKPDAGDHRMTVTTFIFSGCNFPGGNSAPPLPPV